MKSLKLAFVLAIFASLGGCITPQELYRQQLAEAACGKAGPGQGGRMLGCFVGQFGPKA